jgi:hypothetical protein
MSVLYWEVGIYISHIYNNVYLGNGTFLDFLAPGHCVICGEMRLKIYKCNVYIRPWKDHFKSDLRSDQDHLLK